MAADVDRPGGGLTRKAFLVAVACAAAALVVGRRWGLGSSRSAEADARPRRAENLVEHVRASGVELRPTPVDPHGPIFRLNRSAALVWRSVDGRRTVTELAAVLAAAYGISSTAARAGAAECLEALAAQGLVIGVPRPGSVRGASPS